MTALPATTDPTVDADGSARPVTVRLAPRREPPFDDELTDSLAWTPGPWDQPLPFPVSPPPDRRVGARAAAAARAPRRPLDLPDAAVWTRRLMTSVFETVSGRRPPRQLAPLLSPPVAAAFAGPVARDSRLGRMVAVGPGPVVRSVRVGHPTERVAEVALTLAVGPRVHAVALRLEAAGDTWRCVRMQIG